MKQAFEALEQSRQVDVTAQKTTQWEISYKKSWGHILIGSFLIWKSLVRCRYLRTVEIVPIIEYHAMLVGTLLFERLDLVSVDAHSAISLVPIIQLSRFCIFLILM
jgi:hypothetical protein